MKLEYGFVDFTGRKWPDIWVDEYNRLTDCVDRSASESQRERRLNGRHNVFMAFVMSGSKTKECVL